MIMKTIGVIGLTLSVSAHAAIVSLDSTFGADTITRDTVTGLDWLDVTVTRGLSYDQVKAQTVVGGTYEGYRYASTEELDQLITNFGYVAIDQECDYGLTNCDFGIRGDSLIVENIILTLGDTYDAASDLQGSRFDVSPTGAGFTTGMLGTAPQAVVVGPGIGVGLIYDLERVYRESGEPVVDDSDRVRPTNRTVDPSYASPVHGSFLVVVPIPATGWLFISAVAGLVGSKRYQKNQLFDGRV